jgi:uncharacterized surface protein with fasciclin (FAS1) repeats
MSYQEQTTVSQGEGQDQNLLTRSVFETLARNESLRTVSKAMEMGGYRAILDGPGAFTVFAVSEEALDRTRNSLRDALTKKKTADIKRWIGRHIAKGKQLEADLKMVANVPSIEGESLPVSHSDGHVQVNGFNIVRADIACTNGVIHIVDWTANK